MSNSSDDRPDDPSRIYYTILQAAKYLQMHPESLRRIAREGRIEYGRIGEKGPYRFTQKQLDEFVERNGGK
ncbi:helix-turn-helix domain-containing protein [Elusimicrobiota bacterium]